MTPSIAVTLDGSDKDERALAVAAAIAELANATIRVLQVVETPLDAIPPRAAERMRVAEYLRQTAQRLGESEGATISWDALDGADVGRTLLDDIEAHDPTIVVMATRAAGAVGRAIQGSVADHLVRESPRPVVLVPPHAGYMSGKHVTIRRVLVPLDGSEGSLRVLPLLETLAQAGTLDVVLLQVVRAERIGGHLLPPGTASAGQDEENGGEWTHAAAAVAEQRLGAIAEQLRVGGSQVEVRVIESTDVGGVIIDSIRDDLVELIAMSTRGESGLQRLVLGSVAEYVVRRSEVPVLLVTAQSKTPRRG